MKKKFYIYETKKFVYIDPENQEAFCDGYSEEDNTISKEDFIELDIFINEEAPAKDGYYTIQGARSFIDYIFGRATELDLGSSFEITTKQGTKIEFIKKHKIEVDTSVKPNSDLISCINRKQELENLGCFLFGMEDYDINFDSSWTYIQDNLAGGIDVRSQSKEMALVLCKRIKLPGFKGWYN